MRSHALVITLVGLTSAGCQEPLRTAEPTTAPVHVSADDGFDRLWTGCEEVLRRNGFEMESLDRRARRMTTRPVTSQHFFELWRRDVDTAYDFLEGSMLTIRRRVELELTPIDLAGGYSVSVAVHRERFTTPPRQYNSSAAAFQAFGGRLPGVRGETEVARDADEWYDDGRDPAVERRLLEEILAHAEDSPAAAPAEGEDEPTTN